uniref:Uncharacterized protein n=1 Tax=viral metagenome TaxID=1070528 RepID=A0A2V0RAF4_9ZZZZ
MPARPNAAIPISVIGGRGGVQAKPELSVSCASVSSDGSKPDYKGIIGYRCTADLQKTQRERIKREITALKTDIETGITRAASEGRAGSEHTISSSAWDISSAAIIDYFGGADGPLIFSVDNSGNSNVTIRVTIKPDPVGVDVDSIVKSANIRSMGLDLINLFNKGKSDLSIEVIKVVNRSIEDQVLSISRCDEKIDITIKRPSITEIMFYMKGFLTKAQSAGITYDEDKLADEAWKYVFKGDGYLKEFLEVERGLSTQFSMYESYANITVSGWEI